MIFDQVTPVLVSEDTIYLESRRRDSNGLMFNRKAVTVAAALPLLLLLPASRPAWSFFQPDFVSVIPVLEVYDQPTVTVPYLSQPVLLFPKARPPPEVEPEFQRANHQLYFQLARPTASIPFSAFTSYVPDFCDHPWIEWTHPGQNPEAAIFPFRQILRSARGQQFNLYFGQPPPWRIDSEQDVYRRYDSGLFAFRQTVPLPQITTCGELSAYDYGNGKVLVTWGPFIGGPVDSYNVYVNGIFNQNVVIFEALVPGLIYTSYAPSAIPPTPNNSTRPQSMPPTGVVTPSNTYLINVVAVRFGVEQATSDVLTITAQPTSLELVTPMKRVFPFPNTDT